MTLLLYKDDGSVNLPVFISVVAIMILSLIFLMVTINENKLSKIAKEEEKAFYLENDMLKEGLKEEQEIKKIVILQILRRKNACRCKKKLCFYNGLYFPMVFLAYNAVKTAFSRYADRVWGYSGGIYTFPLMVHGES